MSFIPSTPNEKNDYRNALRVAKTKTIGEWYIVTRDDLKRNTDYSAQGALQGFEKIVAAGKLPFEVAKGEDDTTGAKVVALKRTA